MQVRKKVSSSGVEGLGLVFRVLLQGLYMWGSYRAFVRFGEVYRAPKKHRSKT